MEIKHDLPVCVRISFARRQRKEKNICCFRFLLEHCLLHFVRVMPECHFKEHGCFLVHKHVLCLVKGRVLSPSRNFLEETKRNPRKTKCAVFPRHHLPRDFSQKTLYPCFWSTKKKRVFSECIVRSGDTPKKGNVLTSRVKQRNM